MPDAPPDVDIPAEFTSFKYPLPHLAEALRGKWPVRIVAMGSSSTAGREDVVPYPHRLEMYLRVPYKDRFPDLRIDVLNRGGEDAIEELHLTSAMRCDYQGAPADSLSPASAGLAPTR
jgi:hypothetical protein